MRGFSGVVVLGYVSYIAFSFRISPGSCSAREGPLEPEGHGSPSGGSRRGSFLSRLRNVFRRTLGRGRENRPSGLSALLGPSGSGIGRQALSRLSESRGKATPTCDFDQQGRMPADYSQQEELWLSAHPPTVQVPYAVRHPVQPNRETHIRLTFDGHVIRHPGCLIAQVKTTHATAFGCSSQRWLLEVYPAFVSPNSAEDVFLNAAELFFIPFLQNGLQFYNVPDAKTLREELRVLLPAAVVERTQFKPSNIYITTHQSRQTMLARVGLLKWLVFGNVKDIIQSIYDMQLLHNEVYNTPALGGLLSITHQAVAIVARLHSHGFVIGDLVAQKFLVAKEGTMYLDGMKHLKQAMDQSIPGTYKDLLHSPPEVNTGQTPSFNVQTDTFQLGFMLLQLWCGGFRSTDESLSNVRNSPAMASYHQIRAGLNAALNFGGCLEHTPDFVKAIISEFLKPEARTSPSDMMSLPQFSQLAALIS